MEQKMNCIELCAGAGGQALGLEQAGFSHMLLIDNDKHCIQTLRTNRPAWNVLEHDIKAWKAAKEYAGRVDLLAAGLPCPPFSVAGKQLGNEDERDLFPAALNIIDTIRPRAVLIENVRGFLDPVFSEYREHIRQRFHKMGYEVDWKLLNACEFGVPQLRPRVVIVAMPRSLWSHFSWPKPNGTLPQSVGDVLYDLMAAERWEGADKWRRQAIGIAPTIVGGSRKHGGPDLGPSRAKKAWAALGINGHIIAEAPPSKYFEGMPGLTLRMVARIQGFPDTWHFTGRKTHAYRQIGNAFPPPVACAAAKQILKCLKGAERGKIAV